MPLRARIVAVVSSEEQAKDRLASLDEQERRSRAEIERNGWIEIAPPMRVWQSRDYYSLSDLRRDSVEYDELLKQAEAGVLDLLVGRDHSRVLGRTEALQAALRSHLALCRVQTYFYSAPVQPLDPALLGRRGRAQIGGRYLDAIAAVRDEEEVARLVARRETGMNRHAESGRWRLAGVPFGYRRPVLAVVDGKRIYGEMEIDLINQAHLLKFYQDYAAGASLQDIYVAYCKVQGVEPRPRVSGTGATHRMMSNPAYIGVMVYGARRQDVRIEDGATRKVTSIVLPFNRKTELAEAWLRDEDGRTDEEKAAGVIVAWGTWPAIVPVDVWRAVQHERRTRGPRPSSTYRQTRPRQVARNLHPLSGLMVCGHCGGPMVVTSFAYDEHLEVRRVTGNYNKRPRYGCNNKRWRTGKCDAKNGRLSIRLQEELLATLATYAAQPGLLEQVLEQPALPQADEQEMARLAKAVRKAELAISQWDRAFEAGDITLEERRTKTRPHQAAIAEASAKLKSLEATEERHESSAERVGRVRRQLDALPSVEGDPAALKRALRQMIKQITITNRHVARIEFL